MVKAFAERVSGFAAVVSGLAAVVKALAPLLVLCLLLAPAPGAAQTLEKVAVLVGEGVVLQSELEQRERKLQKLVKQQKQFLNKEKLREAALEQLILESLQLQIGRRAGIKVSEEELTAAINEIAQRHNIGISVIREKAEEEGVSWEEYRNNLRNEIIIAQVQQGSLRQRITISDSDIDRFLKTDRAKELLQISYHSLYARLAAGLPAETKKACLAGLRQNINAETDLLAAAGKAGAACRWTAKDWDWRTAGNIPTLFEDILPKLKPGELSSPVENQSGLHIAQLLATRGGKEEVVEQTRVRHILLVPGEQQSTRQSELRMKDLRKQIVGGKDFTELAFIYSEDPGSRSRGGDLGWLSPGEADPRFEAQVQQTEIGQTSPVFETDSGWHILQVMEKRSHDVGPEKLRQKARQALFSRQYQEELENWLNKIRDEAHVEIRI